MTQNEVCNETVAPVIKLEPGMKLKEDLNDIDRAHANVRSRAAIVAAAGTDDFESLSRDDKEAMVAALKARRYSKPRSQEGRQGQGSQGGAKRCRHHYRWGIQSTTCEGGACPERNKVKDPKDSSGD